MKKRILFEKKGQAIGELLMRLGGLILLLSLIVLVLIKFGVIEFNDSLYKEILPKVCLFKSGLDCIDDAIITNETVTIVINNMDKLAYKLNSFELEVIHPVNSTCTTPFVSESKAVFPVEISSKSSINLNFSCSKLISKDYFEATTIIKLSKSFSSVEVVYNGKIIGDIK